MYFARISDLRSSLKQITKQMTYEEIKLNKSIHKSTEREDNIHRERKDIERKKSIEIWIDRFIEKKDVKKEKQSHCKRG